MSKQKCEGAWMLGVVGAIVVGCLAVPAWVGFFYADSAHRWFQQEVLAFLTALAVAALFTPWVICQFLSLFRSD